MRMGPTELIIILLIVLLLFGAKRLPDLAGSIGSSLKEFRKATDDGDADADGGEGGDSSTRASDPDSDAGR